MKVLMEIRDQAEDRGGDQDQKIGGEMKGMMRIRDQAGDRDQRIGG